MARAWPGHLSRGWDDDVRAYIDTDGMPLSSYVPPSGSDDTAALQAFLNGLQTGARVIADSGNVWNFTQLTLSVPNVTFTIANQARMIKTGDPTQSALEVPAAGVKINGLGTIESPASWDGVSAQPHYGVIHITGNDCEVADINLVNVPKVGVYFDDTNKIRVSAVKIVGNYPPASYTGVETSHFAIAYNPGASGGVGRGVITGCDLSGCVQGIFIGNYGANAVPSEGLTITGNSIHECHNHGVYHNSGVDAVTISGNAFSRCAQAVVMTGKKNALVGNTIYTAATGDNLDRTAVQMRDPIGCVVVGNTITGDVLDTGVVIDFRSQTGTEVTGNVCADNTIEVAGAGGAIRVGTSSTTMTCNKNIVHDNAVKAGGQPGAGLIQLWPKTGAVAYGNSIHDNKITITGETNGIYAANASDTKIHHNHTFWEANYATAKTLSAVLLTAITNSEIKDNKVSNVATFGTNLTLRGVAEAAGCSGNSYRSNKDNNAAGLTSYTKLVTLSGSGADVQEAGTGAPANIYCGQGSTWRRTDGGAATSLYVKETDSTSNAGWVGK